jgi:hypothetical protein
MPLPLPNSNQEEIKQSQKIIAYLEKKEIDLNIAYGALLEYFTDNYKGDTPLESAVAYICKIERMRRGNFEDAITEEDMAFAKKEISLWQVESGVSIKSLYLDQDPLNFIQVINL